MYKRTFAQPSELTWVVYTPTYISHTVYTVTHEQKHQSVVQLYSWTALLHFTAKNVAS